MNCFAKMANILHYQMNCSTKTVYIFLLFIGAYTHERKVKISGPTRKAGRGLPSCVLQQEVHGKEELRRVRGTVKGAVLEGDDDMPGLVAVSYYDQKPVHFLSTICEEIRWIKLQRKVYCNETQSMVSFSFLRLNINNAYNKGMGEVDVADQLRNSYRFDHWLRKQKWWHAFFFWGFGVLLVNAYIAYRTYCEDQNIKPVSQYEFRKSIALAWLKPEVYWQDRYNKNKSNKRKVEAQNDASSSKTSRRSISSMSTTTTTSGGRAPRLMAQSLDPTSGSLRIRLKVGPGLHMPSPSSRYAKCALCHFCQGKRTKAQILRCATCNVSLCLSCYQIYHTKLSVSDRLTSMNETNTCLIAAEG